MIPELISSLKKLGGEVAVQAGAGAESGFGDGRYEAAGASVTSSRKEIFARSEVILQVRTLGANLNEGRQDLELFRAGQILIGMAEPLSQPRAAADLAERGVTLMALELMPRITRAQSMDVLSSMATIAGYKAVLLAAVRLSKIFPMLMTAAGTLTPAKVFVIGAGVAGLQAIATARRLGAVVSGYDVRPVVKEQVESLGARFIVMELETGSSEDKGGYAKAMDEEFYRKQRIMMTKVVAENDVVITTAAVPGRKAPVLITAEMVMGMSAGSVIVDLAAEQGGNCELTRAGETVQADGVTIMGPLNLPATAAHHASQMFARNVSAFLKHLLKDGQLQMNLDDEITRETLVAMGGQIVHPRIRQLMGLGAPANHPAMQGGSR
jgi:NAD(P) transhydrogenase subunit alpha